MEAHLETQRVKAPYHPYQIGPLQKTKKIKLGPWVSAMISVLVGVGVGQSTMTVAKWSYDEGKNWVTNEIVQNDPVYKEANKWLDQDIKEGWLTQEERPAFELNSAFNRWKGGLEDQLQRLKKDWVDQRPLHGDESRIQFNKKWLDQYSLETSGHSHVNLVRSQLDRYDATGFATDQGDYFKVKAKSMVLQENDQIFYSFWSGQNQEEYRFVFEHEMGHVLKNSHHPWWGVEFHPQELSPEEKKRVDHWMDMFGHGRFMGLETEGIKGWSQETYDSHLVIEKLQGEIISDSYALVRNLERAFKIQDAEKRQKALMQWKANAIHLWGGRFLETTSGGGDQEHWTAQVAWTWLNTVNQPQNMQKMEKANPYQWTRWSQEVGVYSWLVTLQDQAQQFKNKEFKTKDENQSVQALSEQDWAALKKIPLRNKEWTLSEGLKVPRNEMNQEYLWGRWNFQDLIQEAQKKEVITSLKKQINEMVVLEKMKEKSDELKIERQDRPWEKIDGWKWVQFVQTENQGVKTTLFRSTHQIQDITSIQEVLKQAYEKGMDPINQWHLSVNEKGKEIPMNRQFDDYCYDEIITSYVWKNQQETWTPGEQKEAQEKLDRAFGVTLSARWSQDLRNDWGEATSFKISKVQNFKNRESQKQETRPAPPRMKGT